MLPSFMVGLAERGVGYWACARTNRLNSITSVRNPNVLRDLRRR